MKEIINTLEIHTRSIGLLSQLIEQQDKKIAEQAQRIKQLENYKGLCIGNGIWPVDTGGKMKEI